MRSSSIYVAVPALAAALVVGAGCSRQDQAVIDTATGDVTVTGSDSGASAAAATRTPVSTERGIAADSEHFEAVEARFGPAKNVDHTFLRMMADHHQGLIAMTAPVLDQAVNEATTADARRLHDKQQRELREMLTMLSNKFGEQYEPSVLPSNRAMIDSLGRATGAAYDTLFYRQVIAHHQQGLEMMGKYLPDLEDAKLKAMAEKMRAEHARETDELEKKL
jgi:uncharacterized protein (DUF305 family)